MKKMILFPLLGLTFLVTAQQTHDKKIEGSGKITTEERSLNNFTNIQSEGSCDVVITQDASQKVVVKTDDNIMPYIKTEVSNGKLRIFFSKDYRNYKTTTATVYVSASLIEDINLMGSGNISSTNQLNCKSPLYSVSGSGNMNLWVAAETIETSLAGSGNIALKGSATSAVHSITGSGNIKAMSLTCTDAKITIVGSGNCLVNAATSLDVSITGSGDVKYKGNPKVTKTTTGSGNVKHCEQNEYASK